MYVSSLINRAQYIIVSNKIDPSTVVEIYNLYHGDAIVGTVVKCKKDSFVAVNVVKTSGWKSCYTYNNKVTKVKALRDMFKSLQFSEDDICKMLGMTRHMLCKAFAKMKDDEGE